MGDSSFQSRGQWALFAGFAVVLGVTTNLPANAADLSGDCCADLEERVAELEATTVRRGNKNGRLSNDSD